MKYFKKTFINRRKKSKIKHSTINIRKVNYIVIIILLFTVFLSTNYIFAADSNGDYVDDSLVVSIAAAGVQSFPESDAGSTDSVSEIDFDNDIYDATNLTNGSTIQARRLYGANANTLVNIGTGSGSLTQSTANVYGGAGGAGNYITAGSGNGTSGGWELTFTNTQNYVGLWWSAGNADNNLQLINSSGTNLLSPAFTTASITSALLDNNSCPGTRPTTDEIAAAPWKGYCGNPVKNPDGTFKYSYINEPFAFIHLRFSNGFDKVRVWGAGFEMDNLTFSETVPTFGAVEEVVGDLSVSTNLPDVLLVDPRATTINFPSLSLSNSNNAMICFIQVADATGAAINGSSNLNISRLNNTTGVTENIGTNIWRYSGTRSSVENQINSIQISGTLGNPLVSSGSKWLEVHVTSRTSGDSDCTSNIQVRKRIELRSIGIDTTQNITVNVN